MTRPKTEDFKYPGTPEAVAAGYTNVNGRRLLFFEPEGEHAAAAVTAGMSMVGLRAANFSSGLMRLRMTMKMMVAMDTTTVVISHWETFCSQSTVF